MTPHFVYILFSSTTGEFYTEETVNLDERVVRHNDDYYEDKWSKKGKPWKLYFSIVCDCKQQALKIERHIKSMKSHTYVENLKKYPEIAAKLKAKYPCTDC